MNPAFALVGEIFLWGHIQRDLYSNRIFRVAENRVAR